MPPENNDHEERRRDTARALWAVEAALKDHTKQIDRFAEVLPELDKRTVKLETQVESQGKCLKDHKDGHKYWTRRIGGGIVVAFALGAVVSCWDGFVQALQTIWGIVK